LSSSGRGGRGRGGRCGSASERDNSRSRGGSPANYRGNYEGHQGHFGGPSDTRGDDQNHGQSRGNLALSGGANPTTEVEVNLETNFFEIDTKNVERFYHYGLTIEVPDGGSISCRVKQRIVYLLVKELKGYDNSVPVATNYHDLLVSVQPVSIQQFPHTVHIRYYDEDERQARPDPEPGSSRWGPMTYSVEINQLASVRIADLLPPRANSLDDSVESALAALNTLFNHRPRQYCVRSPSQDPIIAAVGAFRFFALNEAHDLSGGLEARRGLFKSSRLAKDRVLLIVGSSTSAFYQPGCLYDLLEAWWKTHKHDWYPPLETFIKGVRVKTNYLIGHGQKANGSPITEERIYTITGLGRTDDHPVPGNVHFKLDNEDAKDQKSNPSKVSVANASTGKPHKVAKNILAKTTTRSVGSHFKTGQSFFQPLNRGELSLSYSIPRPGTRSRQLRRQAWQQAYLYSIQVSGRSPRATIQTFFSCLSKRAR
jgi:N-terminal domain of argonaute/Argonaute linker 1 domain